MRKVYKITLLCTTLILNSCSSVSTAYPSKEEAMENVIANYSPGAITIDIQTDPDLNSVRGFSSSCTILILQTKTMDTLKNLQSNPSLIKNIFSDVGAHEDILKVDRYTSMPGQQIKLHIDRSENTRYLALIAGYYPFPQKQHMIISSIPSVSKNHGWLFDNWFTQLSPLTLQLRLGSKSIIEFNKHPSESSVK